MKEIIREDLERWRENSLQVADQMYSDYHVLRFLKRVPLRIIPEDSGRMLYGIAFPEPPRVEVYRTNPSRNLSSKNWELYNQSGMDHELIGHLYSMLGIFPDSSETTALAIQREMATQRAIQDPGWSKIAELIPLIPTFKSAQGDGRIELERELAELIGEGKK